MTNKKVEEFILNLIDNVSNQTPERLSENKANIKKGFVLLGIMEALILIIIVSIVAIVATTL